MENHFDDYIRFMEFGGSLLLLLHCSSSEKLLRYCCRENLFVCSILNDGGGGGGSIFRALINNFALKVNSKITFINKLC